MAEKLEWVFLAVPHYCLPNAIRNVYNAFARNDICDTFVKQNTAMSEEEARKLVCKESYFCCGKFEIIHYFSLI